MSKIVRKVFWNKKNGQGHITLPKKQLVKTDPSIKFNEELFVKLEVFRKKRS